MAEVSIIIVNFKSWKHLENCLASIEKIDQTIVSFEVIVVDNCSNDGVLPDFKKNYSSIQFIENSGNNGFSNGCNLGAKNANGTFFMFLNPDTIINENSILLMLKLAKKNDDYGIVSCQTINKKGKSENQVRIFPKLMTLFGAFRAIYKLVNKSKIESDFNSSKDIVFPDWVSGSLIFMNKKWFDKVKYWNEDYWMYFEDVDLCKRVSEKGGRIVITRGANIIHNHGGASRINVKTAVITKSEVLISKHVYVKNNFKGIGKYISQIFLVFQNLVTYLLLAIIGLIFFFVPKLKLNIFLFKNLLSYYFRVVKKGSWLSMRSMNYN